MTRWIAMSNSTKTFEGLFDLILRDQFLHVCNQDLTVFLKQNVPTSIQEMAQLADQYREARYTGASSLCSKMGQLSSSRSAQPVSRPKSNIESSKFHSEAPEKSKGKPFVPMSDRKCFKCGKQGHIAPECKGTRAKFPAAACDTESEEQLECGEVLDESRDEDTFLPNCSACIVPQNTFIDTTVCDTETVLSSACHSNVDPMPLAAGYVEGKPVTLLRDSGCRRIVVRKSLLDQSKLTGKTDTCVLADGTKRCVPIAKIFVDTPYVVGEFDAWCMDQPVFDLIIGEVSGARKPHDPDPCWKPALAVQTRQQRKGKPYVPLHVPDIIKDDIKPEDIKQEQASDPTLQTIRKLAEDGKTSGKGKVRWFVRNGLVYREYQVDPNKTFTQLVVPTKFRLSVLKLAHESIMAGHLGTKRTIDRVLSEFYWPGVQSATKRFCQSCDICQRTVPKGKITRVPLQKMPLIDVPFKRVAVDIVGPLFPATDRGNRFILTLVDYATRYPEAVALPSIDTERVAEALVEIFCRIGVPHEMLTDMGSQFTSKLLSEVSRLISLNRLTTTPYHPMCNGLVEKFNGTLKQMLKRMCVERPKDWDKYLPAVLFAYREVPQESLGFSPFELVYGRSVRGPMAILKELWTNEVPDDQVKSTYQYVLDLRDRLESTCDLARQNLQKASSRYKKYFDRRSKVRNMKIGDKVLVLLPTDNNKLLLQWKGPYTIVKKVGHVDYQIEVGGKLKTFHANLLKHYVERNIVGNLLASVSSYEVGDDTQVFEYADMPEFPVQSTETIADVDINPSLSDNQRAEIVSLLRDFAHLFTDLPGTTNVLKHDIKTTTDRPIRIGPRQIPFAMIDTVRDEIENMLKLGVIEPSTSPYSSPIVIVKKKDGSNRFCIDFRALNRVTIFDAEPMSDAEAMFAKLAGHTCFSRLDLSKGYWQVPLTESSQPLTAFQTPQGLFQFCKMPFGLVTAPATFCRLMRKVLHNMTNVDNFIDDILVYTESYDQHIKILSELFTRLQAANLNARPSKCSLAYSKLDCLGHVIGEEVIRPHPSKVTAIQEALPPNTKKQLRSFLGLVGFYRKFIPNFSHIALPLTDLTRKFSPNKILWGESQEIAFRSLKSSLTKSPILKLPNVKDAFFLQTDASDRGVGAVLMQMGSEQKMPIAYASRKLKPSEEHYATIEKECLAIIWAIQKFHNYLYGREFILETDHHPLVYLNKTKMSNPRLMRWALALQPYRFRIEAIRGRDNVGADYLSRI